MKAKKRALFSGVVRPYDLQNPRVKAGYALMTLLCVFAALVAIMPVVWVILSGFKDLKEFNRGVKPPINTTTTSCSPSVFRWTSTPKPGTR